MNMPPVWSPPPNEYDIRARIDEQKHRMSKTGTARLPTAAILVALPFIALFKLGRLGLRLIKRRSD